MFPKRNKTCYTVDILNTRLSCKNKNVHRNFDFSFAKSKDVVILEEGFNLKYFEIK